MSKLKPCPFCGGRAFIMHTEEPVGHSYRAYCGNEDCAIEPRTHRYFRREQAIESWNRRHQSEESKREAMSPYYIYIPVNGKLTSDNYTCELLKTEEAMAYKKLGYIVSRTPLPLEV